MRNYNPSAAEIDAALSSWFPDARTGWKGNPHFANRAFWRDMMRHALIAAHAARITIYADTPRRIAPHDRDGVHPGPTGLPTRPYGVGAPKNTPIEIIDTLNKEINAGLTDPKLKGRLNDLGGSVLSGSSADFGKLIAEETAKVVRAANIKAE